MIERLALSSAWPALLAIVVLGCARDPVSTEVAAPGVAARVVWTEAGATGGTPYKTETHIDSASGRYTIRSCGVAWTPCPTLRLVRVDRSAEGPARSSATTRPRFRALNANYANPSGIVRPTAAARRSRSQRTRRTISCLHACRRR
jgi:hypothetical protein